MPAPRKLTETYIRSLKYEGKPYLVRDTHTTGLMIAVNKKSKTWKVQRDLWRGPRGYRRLLKTCRHTLGSTDDLTLEDARSQMSRIWDREHDRHLTRKLLEMIEPKFTPKTRLAFRRLILDGVDVDEVADRLDGLLRPP